jgi:benzoyl-CoA reductase/2-hydroxyglutaryl-CoA dehydratase subunit BcrC/BadD/HgdB
MNEELLYQAPGLLVNPVTDQNFKMVGEVWRFLTGEEVAYMGVPKIKDDLGIHTFQICLNVLKEKLEAFTGNKITEKGLNGAIELYNKMRGLLKAIGDMRKSDKFIISSRDFVRLNHASYILDPSVMVEILESLYEELKTAASVTRSDKRILFVGSTLAMGDNQIFDILDDLTGDIVFEEFAEGIRPYMYNVALNGDPMAALTDALYVKRLPPAYFRPFEEFQSRMLGLVSEHRANGILWYQMMMRDSYDMQYYLFEAKVLKDLNIPIIKIESEYDTNEKGQLKTRLETFVSIMK